MIVIDAGPENVARTSKPEIDPAPVVLSSVRAKGAAAAKPIKTPAPKRNTTSTIRRKPTAKAASRTPVYKVAAAVQKLNLHTEMGESGNQTRISGNESVCISTHHFSVLDGAHLCWLFEMLFYFKHLKVLYGKWLNMLKSAIGCTTVLI